MNPSQTSTPISFWKVYAIVMAVNLIIYISVLFLIVVPAVTPVGLSILIGIPSGVVALILKAKRTAIVVFAFALTPLCSLLAMEYIAEFFGTDYVASIPLVVSVLFAIWALIDYSMSRRAVASAAT